MFQGFYNLTSGVLTQTRRLNVISNNMTNVSTPGFRKDTFTSTTFREEMIYRSGNKNKSNPTELGAMNRIVTAGDNVTDYTNNGYASTESPLDFALKTKGFFTIQSANGNVYTRNGSFTLDDQGYLFLPGVGRVMGQNGPLRLGTDKISVDNAGNIFAEEGGQLLGRFQITDFQDYDTQLTKTTGDVFVAQGQGNPVNAEIASKALENSNVDPIAEMTQMMGSQRALQSSAQVLKMYDQLTGKIVSQLGPA